MALRSQIGRDSDSPGFWLSTWLARNLPTALRGHRFVFAHGDLQRKTILVEEELAGEGQKEGEPMLIVTVILDWEDGVLWYPSYWEYSSSFIGFCLEDDWPEKLGSILDLWPLEASFS
ncbi:hypothetical protein VMCG_08749 [Cytospora schulzeri]|uniref:Aminoglycoside phosphotransferase domain-containing protein n=1 Tax=Cytospora schulzeri TaxID=448051 RepID=A0A423VQG7_9PEZI|nr:hypothetical protein VMCG_08749 [Valsa malicola]